MQLVVFYVPCPNEEEAKKLIQTLLHEKLIACGNIIKSSSLYVWDERLEDNSEWVVIMKTVSPLVGPLENRISECHPYQIPAILHWDARCNEKYLAWVSEQVKY
jgi:periplasmic divalent cation tolerance protein